jgi:hypothetical protein
MEHLVLLGDSIFDNARDVPDRPPVIEQVRLRAVLEAADKKLTREELPAAWPAGDAMPADVSLWSWLDEVVAEGRVLRDGRPSLARGQGRCPSSPSSTQWLLTDPTIRPCRSPPTPSPRP